MYKIKNGERVKLTEAEALVIESYVPPIINDNIRINALELQCYAYQISRSGFKCPANFYAMLTGAKGGGLVGEKAAKCLVALDMLWSLYDLYKSDSEMEVEFEVAGKIPYSFDEVRVEIEAL